MTRDELKQKVLSAGWNGWLLDLALDFYDAGVEHEREACAKVAEGPAGIDDEEAYWGREIAKAIRARGHA